MPVVTLPDGSHRSFAEPVTVHDVAADIGATIVAHAELMEIERNRLTFKVAAYNADRKIGEGTHKRAIIKTGG